jgi:transposase InsO family protein
VWQQLRRQGIHVARCTVRRRMQAMGLPGAVRGRAWATTMQPAITAERPSDLVERYFAATRPNSLWVAALTYVATWRSFVYLAFVIDVVARRVVVGWRVSKSLRTEFVLDAVEQAICFARGGTLGGMVRQIDHCNPYLSVRYTNRLADADIAQPISRRGDFLR